MIYPYRFVFEGEKAIEEVMKRCTDSDIMASFFLRHINKTISDRVFISPKNNIKVWHLPIADVMTLLDCSLDKLGDLRREPEYTKRFGSRKRILVDNEDIEATGIDRSVDGPTEVIRIDEVVWLVLRRPKPSWQVVQKAIIRTFLEEIHDFE